MVHARFKSSIHDFNALQGLVEKGKCVKDFCPLVKIVSSSSIIWYDVLHKVTVKDGVDSTTDYWPRQRKLKLPMSPFL